MHGSFDVFWQQVVADGCSTSSGIENSLLTIFSMMTVKREEES